jgi:hypothetical protein
MCLPSCSPGRRSLGLPAVPCSCQDSQGRRSLGLPAVPFRNLGAGLLSRWPGGTPGEGAKRPSTPEALFGFAEGGHRESKPAPKFRGFFMRNSIHALPPAPVFFARATSGELLAKKSLRGRGSKAWIYGAWRFSAGCFCLCL